MTDPTEPVFSAREAYHFCARSDRASIELALETRGADAAALALIRANLAMVDGDSLGADGILTRALAKISDPDSAGYLIDSLVSLLISRHEFDRAAAILERDPPRELLGTHASLVAVLAAAKGDRDAAKAAYAEAEGLLRDVEDDLLRSKIVGRGALVAFNIGQFHSAAERALYAAERAIKSGAPRTACMNYSMLAAVYREQFGDVELARYYAARMTVMAIRANDITLTVFGLSIQIEVAAESGEVRQLTGVRRRLRALASGVRYYERWSIAIGEILPEAWAGNFVGLGGKASALREGERSDVERMFCESLLALSSYARGFRDEANAWCESVAARGGQRASHEFHQYRMARIIVAHVDIACGRLHRGRRSLLIDALRGVPEEGLASLVSTGTVSEDACPAWLRGYARAICVADAAAKKVAPVTVLSRAETELLPIVALGKPVREVALELGKSEATVRTQIREIARKLGTHSLVESLAEAKRLGLF